MAAMDDREHTRPSPETREEERREAKDAADAGREPTPEEEEAADRNEPDEEVAEHYEEMTERGAKQRGKVGCPERRVGCRRAFSQRVLSLSKGRSQADPRQSDP